MNLIRKVSKTWKILTIIEKGVLIGALENPIKTL